MDSTTDKINKLNKLRTLADLFDLQSKARHEVQDDLRKWANELEDSVVGKKLRIKKGVEGAGKIVTALSEPFFCRQLWIAVEIDDEEDPELLKFSCLEIVD